MKLALAESARERLRTRVVLTVKAIAKLLRATVRALSAVVHHDLEGRVAAELDIAASLGSLRGAYGHVVTEYLRPAAPESP